MISLGCIFKQPQCCGISCFRYILDIKWLKQWKSYVGFESWDHYNAGEESANPGPIDNGPLLKGKKQEFYGNISPDKPKLCLLAY